MIAPLPIASPIVTPFSCLRASPTANPPKHKALLIGINYSCGKQDYRSLKGPVNDAKEMKKVLIDVYGYREEDVCLMTDEETNTYTTLWPSKANVLQGLHDLVCNAFPGDMFLFFYAGHSGQQPVRDDPDEIDGLDEYIVTSDYKLILDNTLREYLVDPLPAGTRLTAILDSCHPGTLLDLDHYSCHWFLHRRAQSLFKEKVMTRHTKLSRRYSEDFGRQWLINLTKKQKRLKVVDGVDHATFSSPGIPRPPRVCQYTACALLNGPVVISVSSCADQQRTWEDSQGMGKSMTMKLIKILRKNPSIKVGDLDQQLKKGLSEMAFKRLREIKNMFKMYTAKLSPEKRKEWEEKLTDEGVFEFKALTAQIGSLHPLRLDEQFMA